MNTRLLVGVFPRSFFSNFEKIGACRSPLFKGVCSSSSHFCQFCLAGNILCSISIHSFELGQCIQKYVNCTGFVCYRGALFSARMLLVILPCNNFHNFVLLPFKPKGHVIDIICVIIILRLLLLQKIFCLLP